MLLNSLSFAKEQRIVRQEAQQLSHPGQVLSAKAILCEMNTRALRSPHSLRQLLWSGLCGTSPFFYYKLQCNLFQDI